MIRIAQHWHAQIALGVVGKGCYLQETWNKLDCFIVVSGWVLLTNERPVLQPLTNERLELRSMTSERPVLQPLIKERPVFRPLTNERLVLRPMTNERPELQPMINERPVFRPLTDERPVLLPMTNQGPVEGVYKVWNISCLCAHFYKWTTF